MSTNSNSAQAPGNDFIIPNQTQKREDIQLLEAGPNPGILYQMVDLGTHYNKNFDKSSRLLKLVFEFPLLKQLFKVDDTVPRPTVVSQEYTFMLGENSNLKKLIDGAEGRVLAPHEYKNGWNLGQYLGRVFIIGIVNRPSKKDPTVIYNNIGTVQAVTDKLRGIYAFPWEDVKRTNDLLSFIIDPQGTCFASENFAMLPKYFRETIMKSDEAIAYANSGGRFAQYEDYKDKHKTDANLAPQAKPAQPVQRAPQLPNTPIKKMLVTDFTYEQYLSSGWTDAQLVENGKMEIIQPTVAAAPPMPKAAPQAAPSPTVIDDSLDVVEDDEVPF